MWIDNYYGSVGHMLLQSLDAVLMEANVSKHVSFRAAFWSTFSTVKLKAWYFEQYSSWLCHGFLLFLPLHQLRRFLADICDIRNHFLFSYVVK